MTGAIAKRTATVDVIEADTAQARFCRVRLDQDGVDNVRVVAGGAQGGLPYADGVFDGVVMNLVFEWCALRSSLPHEQVQLAYLAEIARVLKPGGFLFLSTKNRFALRLLTGGRDEHMADKRFGSALPRAIGSALMGGARPHGYLYSFNALHSRIEGAGFRIDTPYWAVPDMRWPTRYIPLDAASVRAARRDPSLRFGTPRIHRLMKVLPASWIKHFTPGLVFLARRLPA
jgi:SAM-dependent methyltransferase